MPLITTEFKNAINNSTKTPRWVWIIITIVVLALLVLGFFYIRSLNQLKQAQKELLDQQSSSNVKTDTQAQDLIAKVGKLIILPDKETPTIATVSDLNKLKDQPFFVKAELGDKVLIYSTAKKAILYRPSTNQIIELAPLLDGAPSTPTTPAASTSTIPPAPTGQ